MEWLAESLKWLIENQGMIATVLLIVCLLLYRQQDNTKSLSQQHSDESKQNAAIMQGMLDNQRTENKRQGEILDVLMIQVTNNSGMATSLEHVKASSLKHTDELISVGKNVRHGITIIEEQTEGIKTMSDKFTHLENAINTAMTNMATKLESGVNLSPEAKKNMITEITNNLRIAMKECLDDAIKQTQETMAIKPDETQPKTDIGKEKL